jgi:hypothetical protein
MSVVWDDIPFLAHHCKKDALSSPTLMGGNDMRKAKNILNRLAKVIKTVAPGIAFIANHHGSPLPRAHSSRAGVGQKIYKNGIGWKQKQVLVSLKKQILSLFLGCPTNGFDSFDFERLDDGSKSFGGHSVTRGIAFCHNFSRAL